MDNLETAKKYYEGWETSNKELLNVSPELKFTSPDGSFPGAKEFLDQCWQFSGVKFQNKIFLSGGDNVCVKYDFPMPDGTAKAMIEWLIFKDGKITNIEVFYNNN
ncbi:MAG TPA: hypothetical protein PKE39_05625 [Ignavibacteria bacterium]|nr:hypothetical protein [Ignavibacteria bacterium]HMQ98483.1 hypothetical protein [Ignavibacteria bacterium]